MNTFIDKWCLAAEVSLVRDPAAASREAEKAAADLKRRLAESHAVQRIASNPLLVTILCVVHRFLGRKIPEHRVTLYEKCTDALLYEWDRAKFEDGAAIGQLDAVAKRRLLMGVARRVHEEHAAEIAEREVVEHFAETLPDLGRPAAEAKAIVEEIRDRSGLLVERRPGFFAFSHLTFQEYFCALDYVRTKSFGELVDHCSEPWWHEVIVLAAGAPGGGGGAIARRLLAHRNLEATFLAAQCLETETDMPSPLRREIEAAIQEMIPPRDPHTMTRLGKLGILAAPNLAMSLPLQTDPRDRQRVLFALEDIDYDPAIPAIVRCASDSDKLVALQATFILARKAGSSYVAMAALREVSPTLPENVVRHVRDHFVRNELSTPEVLAVLDDALKTKRSAAPSPAPAKGTA